MPSCITPGAGDAGFCNGIVLRGWVVHDPTGWPGFGDWMMGCLHEYSIYHCQDKGMLVFREFVGRLRALGARHGRRFGEMFVTGTENRTKSPPKS